MIRLPRTELTLKQKNLLDKIEAFYKHEGYYPSTREIGQILKTSSSNTAFSHLKALSKKGFLKKNSKGKIIAITHEAHNFDQNHRTSDNFAIHQFQQAITSAAMSIPYFSAGAPAGFQAPAEDAGREMLTVDQYLIKSPNNTFAIKVSGHSMERAGILAGDLLLVEKRSDARPGQIIVAHLPSGFTVKRLIEENGQKFLKAESSREYQIRLEEGTEIWGIVIGIIRKY